MRKLLRNLLRRLTRTGSGSLRLTPLMSGEKGPSQESFLQSQVQKRQEFRAGNQKPRLRSEAGSGSAPRRTRTYNPLIKSQLLCQLS